MNAKSSIRQIKNRIITTNRQLRLLQLKKKEVTIWLNEVNSQSLQFALRCLDTAYVNFFRGNAKFPVFKSKRKKNTFTVPQFAELKENILQIPKFREKGLKLLFTGR